VPAPQPAAHLTCDLFYSLPSNPPPFPTRSRSNGLAKPGLDLTLERTMEYATLGNTGLLVSKLCFGTMTFGDGTGLFKAISSVGQAAADELVKTSIEGGINFFDTADNYTEGESEKILGQSLKNLNEETLRALDTLVQQGKVRYIGCSNWIARVEPARRGLAFRQVQPDATEACGFAPH
jgi:aryl-alcohol dehydrogenase-like predicted oxidoreductase